MYKRTDHLGEGEIRELWRFRLTLIDLKPTVTEEQDYQAFAADFRMPGYAWILRDRGAVAGMFLQRGVPLTYDGRRLHCLLPEYGFLAPHLRGHPVLPLGTLLVTLRTLAAHPLLPTYVAASTYPPGYIAFRRVLHPFWTLGDPDLPAWERGLLLHLADRISGPKFRPEDGTVEMRTIPIVARDPAASGHADARRLHADYQAANPQWREGRGLFFLFPLDARQIGRVVLHAADRLRKSRGR